uniref:Solute carrier family 35 member F2 n=1 Tax=Felis catus TaxID=9685 RepID=A0ABI7XCE7_FELCA
MEAASPAGPAAPQPRAPGAAGGLGSLLRGLKGQLCTWSILKTVALGQMLSLCICGTAITSQYLAERYRVNTPMLQSFINYCLLLLFYTVMLAFRSGSDNLLHILKRKWWKYVLLGLADVEANYLIVRAYQYTTLTSVQLLDCFGIPVLMALSWFVLYARYRVIHLIAVAVCLLGVGTMVGADILAGREDNSGSDVLIGDILVLLGASLYAVSNVCEEYIVKKLSRQEFLGMVGLFGTIISGIQLSIVECKDIASIQWDWKIVFGALPPVLHRHHGGVCPLLLHPHAHSRAGREQRAAHHQHRNRQPRTEARGEPAGDPLGRLVAGQEGVHTPEASWEAGSRRRGQAEPAEHRGDTWKIGRWGVSPVALDWIRWLNFTKEYKIMYQK